MSPPRRSLALLLAAACADPVAALPDTAGPPGTVPAWVVQQLEVQHAFLRATSPAFTGLTAEVATLGTTTADLDVSRAALDGRVAGLEASLTGVRGDIASVELAVDDLTDLAPLIVDAAGAAVARAPAAGSEVRLRGQVPVPWSGWDGLNGDDLAVRGGELVGTGGEIVDLGRRSTFTGVTFRDVLLDGSDIRFVGCTFAGAIRLPHGAVVQGGTFETAVVSPNHRVDLVDHAEIHDTVLPRVARVVHSDVRGSVVGEPSGELSHLAHNAIETSTVHLGRSVVATGNAVEDALIVLTGWSDAIVSANAFDGLLPGAAEVLRVEAAGSTSGIVQVHGNTFYGTATTPTFIRISGATTGTYQSLQIHDNTFMRALQAIVHGANVRTTVNDNSLFQGLPIGVAASPTLHLGPQLP